MRLLSIESVDGLHLFCSSLISLTAGNIRSDTSSPMLSTASRSALRQARSRVCSQKALSQSQQSFCSRLLSTLAVLEQREGKLNHASLCAVTAARKLGGPITGFVAGSNIKSVAEEAAKVDGVEKIVMVENGAYDKGLPENFAPLLVENIKKGGYTHIVTGHSAFGKNLMPRVAALLDSQQISDITEIESEDSTFQDMLLGPMANILQHSFAQSTLEMFSLQSRVPTPSRLSPFVEPPSQITKQKGA